MIYLKTKILDKKVEGGFPYQLTLELNGDELIGMPLDFYQRTSIM